MFLFTSFSFYPYYKIIRPLNCIISGFALFVGAIIVLGPTILLNEITIFLLGAFVMFFISAGGFVINDIFDIEIDRINQPWRMLPTKRISIKAAWLYTIGLFSLAIILSVYAMNLPTSLMLDQVPILFSLIGIISLYLYAKWLKRYGIIGNLLIALLAVIPILVGGLFINNFKRAFFPSFVGFFLIYSREIIKDVEDIKGDVEASGKFYSLPVLIGVKNTAWFVRSLFILLIFSTFLPFAFNDFKYFRSYSVAFLVIIIDILLLWLLFILRGSNDELITKSRTGRKLLKINVLLGLTAFLLNPFSRY